MRTRQRLYSLFSISLMAWMFMGCNLQQELHPVLTSVPERNSTLPNTVPIKPPTSSEIVTDPASSHPSPSVTQPIPFTATSSPISTITPSIEYELITGTRSDEEFQLFQGAYLVSVKSDSEFWLARYRLPLRLIHFVDGVLYKEIEIKNVKHTGDIEIVDSGIWILELGVQPQDSKEVLHFDIDGLLINRYEIPAWVYQEGGDLYGKPKIFWDHSGNLLIEWGRNGLYQFMDSMGVKQVRRLDGFNFDNHIYRIVEQKERQDTQIRWLTIDQIWIPITTTLSHVNIEILHVFQNGVYIQVSELDLERNPTTTIRHYSANGELLGTAEVPTSTLPYQDPVFSSDEKVYFLISPSHEQVQLIALKFH